MSEGQPREGDMAQTLDHVMSQLTAATRVDAVFGQPITRGETTVIPCSEVVIGLGMGVGGGSGPGEGEGENKEGTASGSGGGGGGGGSGRPVAVVVISPAGVTFQPIVDATKVALAFFTTFAFVLYWLARLGRATCAGDEEPSVGDVKKAIEG